MQESEKMIKIYKIDITYKWQKCKFENVIKII